MSGPPLVRELEVRKNVQVSYTKLASVLGMDFIGPHLVENELFPVHLTDQVSTGDEPRSEG